VYDAPVQLLAFRRVSFARIVLALAVLAADAFAQPTAPAPPKVPTSPAPAPGEEPNQPQPDVPAPNPDAPPPGTEPVPAPTTTATPAPAPTPPAPTPPAEPQPAGNKTAIEKRLAATAACNAREPTCDWVMTFSSLEKLSIRRSLAELGMEIEPAPWDKVIGRIRIYNEDVFAEANWMRFFNHFHVTTRESSIRAELTINEGEVWNDELIAESARRLKDPLYTGVVALLPVKSAEAGKVDLLVVTRDIWSLRLNTKYTIQEGSLTNFTMSLSENNFLGRRKTVAVGFLMDQGAISVGPLFIDKNFLGQHLDVRARVDKIFTRRSLDVVTDAEPPEPNHFPTNDPGGIQDDGKLRSEGTTAVITVTKTLWSLASKWGGGGSFSYRNAVARGYYGTGLFGYDDPLTVEEERVPYEYRVRSWSATASATRQWGRRFKQGVEVGHRVASVTPSVLSTPAFAPGAIDPTLLEHFKADVFPRDEVVSSPFIEYSIYQAKFATVRNVDTYELGEDIRFGPNASVTVAQSFKTLGSTYRFTRPSASAGWTIPWGRDGFARVSGSAGIRIQDGRTLDNSAGGQVRAATPTLPYFRLIAQVQFETRWNDESNNYFTAGSDSGLRAYRIDQFRGDRRFLAQIEARSQPFPFWVLRLGGVLFYDGGGAADTFRTMKYAHDVGFGLRMLVPQSSRELFRFDLAFPLASAPGTTAGYPRFMAGFDSYF
jgi:hypothetical protein